MIKTLAQAFAIQNRRAVSGKRGYAKAVRRYVAANRGDYRREMNALPVNWARPAKPEKSAA